MARAAWRSSTTCCVYTSSPLPVEVVETGVKDVAYKYIVEGSCRHIDDIVIYYTSRLFTINFANSIRETASYIS
jgi:hypothetical protein